MYCKIIDERFAKTKTYKGTVFNNPDKIKILAIVENGSSIDYLLEANWNGSSLPSEIGGIVTFIDRAYRAENGSVRGGYWVESNRISLLREIKKNSDGKSLLTDSY